MNPQARSNSPTVQRVPAVPLPASSTVKANLDH
jgi:hypothetical protein